MDTMSSHSPGTQRGRRSTAGRGPKEPAPDAEAAILSATEELLASIPLHDLSVAQIIERAGISRATFYFYFESKFAVVAALVKQSIAEIYAASQPTLRSKPGPERIAALSQRVRDSARVWDAHRPVLGATVENWHAYPELRSLWLEMIGGLTEAIALEIEHDRKGGLAPPGPDPRALAALLAWSTERCLYLIGLEELVPAGERDARLDALTQMWLTVMYSDAAANRAAA